ncbi:recombinase family protein [Clostridium ganghwense]|uniref:Recombinase family protein n=1 Tax=Clostridium ganghwense TaxID=312089 RepID=A0ABT4CU68_9CLOT|nr:recombinase family protein [Clostridium ganghwense]MCY6372602.1 recombinase family protein [Clostridium ganghwense]
MTEPFDTSSPSGRFIITMLAGIADLERETILERMCMVQIELYVMENALKV